MYSSAGKSNGLGTFATFSGPWDVALDANSNIYVADCNYGLIRLISSSGLVSTYAGSGTQGFSNGYGTYASFYCPDGVDVDSSNNVYVADSSTHLISKIDASGLVSTLAGVTYSSGSSNGMGTYASFKGPQGVCMGPNGKYVYVADTFNHLIRKIDSFGLVSTYAGIAGSAGSSNGMGTFASFNHPPSICFDAYGNAFVGDYSNHLIRKISSFGVVTTYAGGFNGPEGVAVDVNDNVYVADSGNNMIRVISSSGVVSTYAGSGSAGGANGVGTFASFYNPVSVTLDSNGNIYVGDYYGQMIRKVR